jgi:hypothetical protein
MRKIFILVFILGSSLINIGLIYSQEEPAASEPQAPEIAVGAETQWVWGEIVTVDAKNKIILVKYLDYETDQEKEISINTDDKTTFEGVVNTDEIKPNDTVSIDYIIDASGKNIATNISVEKPQTQEISQQETAPQDLNPPEAVESESSSETENQMEEQD